MSINKRSIGTIKENVAREFLENNGVKIIRMNYRCKAGEIDIIGMDNDTYVFFEVKYRKDLKMGHPAEAVTKYKQRVISRVADYFRYKYKIPDYASFRFDVIAIIGDELLWYKNAFEYYY